MESQIKEIFERITEHLEIPLRLSGHCETSVYYHVEALTPDDIKICAAYIVERILNVCYPQVPDVLITLKDSYTGIASALGEVLSSNGSTLPVIPLQSLSKGNGYRDSVKNAKVLLVNDVITTARSCLKAHSQITMMGGSVLCWAALIDRTFGPGPVPVITAITGEPVILIRELL